MSYRARCLENLYWQCSTVCKQKRLTNNFSLSLHIFRIMIRHSYAFSQQRNASVGSFSKTKQNKAANILMARRASWHPWKFLRDTVLPYRLIKIHSNRDQPNNKENLFVTDFSDLVHWVRG